MDVEVVELEEIHLESILPYRCQMQVHLDLRCNRSSVQPQCPHNYKELSSHIMASSGS